jgi:hypothetical protein
MLLLVFLPGLSSARTRRLQLVLEEGSSVIMIPMTLQYVVDRRDLDVQGMLYSQQLDAKRESDVNLVRLISLTVLI